MAEVLRSQTRNFLGSKVTRLEEHLVISPDCVEMVNADASTGAIVPIKDDTLIDGSVQQSFCLYNDAWVSTDAEAEYLEHNGKLYMTDGRLPKKTYTYLGNEYVEDLGVSKPDTTDADISFYYGSVHTHPCLDAWFFDPLLFGLRALDTESVSTDLDVYKYTETGVTLLQTYHFSTAFGTKLFCGALDSSTVAVFVMGAAAIKWFKYSLAANTFTAQTDITLAGGNTFKSITGDHTTSLAGQWMSGAQTGSRWDSGWLLATSATQLSDGGNSWTGTSNIYVKDTTYADSGDVDTPETPLKSLLAGFTIPTPPTGIENFYVSVRCKYSWASGVDWRWNTINNLQLYNSGWTGNNYAPVGIYQSESGAYEGIIATGDFGVTNGITRAMITDGNLKFGLNFQSGNNGGWKVYYIEIRVFGLIPAESSGDDKFELFAGTTDGLKRYLLNASTGISLIDTTYTGKTVTSCYWDYSNISVGYTDAGGANPKMALLNSYELGGTMETLMAASACEPPAMVCHDPFNEIYVSVDPDLSDSGDGELVCYDNDTATELDRAVLATVGTTFPSGLCADNNRVYVSDEKGSYSDIQTFLLRSMEVSGSISGVYDASAYGKCRSVRKCDDYIVAATSSADVNTFSGIWVYHKNAQNVPAVSHYTPTRGNLNGVYSYGLTYYNAKDDTESEMLLFVNDVYVVNGLVELTNIPQPADTQVTNIRLYRVGGALSSFSLITELELGVTSFKDLIPDSEAGSAISLLGRNKPPLDLRWITEAFGTFFGISGNDLYYTTQANPNYWTLFPLSLGGAGTGLAVTAQGLLAFTSTNRTFFLSGTDSSNFVLYPLSRVQGCVNGKSVQENSTGGVLWMSNDGLCFSNGGKPSVMSKDILGKISLSGITSSAWYDDVYYLAHEDGVFVADFRYNNTVRFRDLSDTEILGMGVFEDVLYFRKSDGVYGAFDSTVNRKVVFKTGVEISTDPLAVKYYKNVRLWYKGRPTIKIYIDGVQYGKSIVLDNKTVLTPHEIGLVDAPSGKYIQYRISGDFELHYLESVYDGNKKLS